jgi:hypothetical protein
MQIGNRREQVRVGKHDYLDTCELLAQAAYFMTHYVCKAIEI